MPRFQSPPISATMIASSRTLRSVFDDVGKRPRRLLDDVELVAERDRPLLELVFVFEAGEEPLRGAPPSFANYEKPEDLTGEDKLCKQLKEALIGRALGTELTL
jgi:hypothetical protein